MAYLLFLLFSFSSVLYSGEEVFQIIPVKIVEGNVVFSRKMYNINQPITEQTKKQWPEMRMIYSRVVVTPTYNVEEKDFITYSEMVSYPMTYRLNSVGIVFPSEDLWKRAIESNTGFRLSSKGELEVIEDASTKIEDASTKQVKEEVDKAQSIFSSNIVRGLIGGGIIVAVLGVGGFLYYKFCYKKKSSSPSNRRTKSSLTKKSTASRGI